MIRIVLALVSVAFLWAGGQGLYTAMRNREPTRLSCQDYSFEALGREWLELDGCELSLIEAAYEDRDGKVTQLYVPLRNPNRAEDDESIHIVLATRDDPELFALTRQLLAIDDDETFRQYVADNRDKLIQTRSVSGLLRYGVDLKEKDRDELKALDQNLVPEFIIVSDGLRPQMGQSLALLGVGLAALLGVVVPLMRRTSAPSRRHRQPQRMSRR